MTQYLAPPVAQKPIVFTHYLYLITISNILKLEKSENKEKATFSLS
jgi:hypothetical protein